MRILLVVIALSAAAFAQSGDEAAVKAAHEAFVNAAKAGDAAALGKLFADDLQYSHSNTSLENKAQAIAALVKGKSNFEVHEQKIKVMGKAATIRARVTAHNATADIPLTILLVWVKNGKQWQLTERQTTRLPAK
ncbi:MAG: nuclear transport factor 2 family protein [Acidobacteria bacterium]|nr:nuclear transport factor 2 family protein [Acidobacteriota bacterium]